VIRRANETARVGVALGGRRASPARARWKILIESASPASPVAWSIDDAAANFSISKPRKSVMTVDEAVAAYRKYFDEHPDKEEYIR
jgi:hypothetical protein